MLCKRFEELLAEETDGPLPSEALQHLEACTSCRNLTEDLNLIRATARDWGTEEAIPSPRVWAAIQARLETDRMRCERFAELVAEETDGPLPVEALQHIEICADCRSLHDDLDAIQIAARDWGSEEAVPSPRVWAAIQAQLETEGLIGKPESETWLTAFWNFIPRLEMAGAYALILLVAAGIAGYRFVPMAASNQLPAPATVAEVSSPSPVSAASAASFEGLSRTLDGNMRQVVASFPQSGSVALSLRDNLTIVDNLIAVCEKTVREHPGDPLALEYLYGAYQQKADLLAVAMDR